MEGLIIRPVSPQDANAVASIYNYYINETIVTFELVAVTQTEMQQRIAKISSTFPFLVAELNHTILGYAYANTWKSRAAYDFAVETSIYLKKGTEGQGIGTKLYGELIAEISKTAIKTAIGGISLPNKTSVVLHEKLGFKKIGVFSKVGFKFNKWIDVGYWQLHF